jgi:hypothetical protein
MTTLAIFRRPSREFESLRDTFPEACFAPVNSVVDASQLAARFFTNKSKMAVLRR